MIGRHQAVVAAVFVGLALAGCGQSTHRSKAELSQIRHRLEALLSPSHTTSKSRKALHRAVRVENVKRNRKVVGDPVKRDVRRASWWRERVVLHGGSWLDPPGVADAAGVADVSMQGSILCWRLADTHGIGVVTGVSLDYGHVRPGESRPWLTTFALGHARWHGCAQVGDATRLVRAHPGSYLFGVSNAIADVAAAGQL